MHPFFIGLRMGFHVTVFAQHDLLSVFYPVVVRNFREQTKISMKSFKGNWLRLGGGVKRADFVSQLSTKKKNL